MGHRNPDRVPLSYRRERCETVQQMICDRWEVLAVCRTCKLRLRVDLRTIAIVRGPGFSLWNRLSKCRSVMCRDSVVEFWAKAPGMTAFERIATPNARDDGLDVAPPRWRP